MTPDKKMRMFGTRGSSPGKFNIVSGITADDQGNIFVTDTLRCVVIAFDKDFNFKTEFGYRGLDPGNLIAPMELVVNNDRVYVSQSRSRGVSVYRIFTTDSTLFDTKGR
jgi:outer membrane protein assembly factor BamB